ERDPSHAQSVPTGAAPAPKRHPGKHLKPAPVGTIARSEVSPLAQCGTTARPQIDLLPVAYRAGEAARTSPLAPPSYLLKLSINSPASFLAAASYAALSPQVSRGHKISAGTPGQVVGTSTPNTGSRLVLALASAPLWIASRIPRVWASLIRLPTPWPP